MTLQDCQRIYDNMLPPEFPEMDYDNMSDELYNWYLKQDGINEKGEKIWE